MAFRDYSNNDPFDRDRRGFEPDPRAYDNRSNWERNSNRPEYRYQNDSRSFDPRDRYNEEDRGEYYRAEFGAGRSWRDDDDPYIHDQRMLRERGEMQRGRDYGYADNHYYYNEGRGNDPRDLRGRDMRRGMSENVDAQQNYERDRPNFRGGGWDQGESMRSSHMNGGREERQAYSNDRGGYTSDPNAWSSMEHDWNNDRYYGGSNRTGDYGSRGEEYNRRDNFGNDRFYSRSAHRDRSRGSREHGSW